MDMVQACLIEVVLTFLGILLVVGTGATVTLWLDWIAFRTPGFGQSNLTFRQWFAKGCPLPGGVNG